MKEIIAFFIVSGGVGFFNLYLAQETDFLYFGKYNKEERIAWLSIFTVVNFIIISIWLSLVDRKGLIWFIIGAFISIILMFSISLLLPKIINETIDAVRKILKKPSRSILPPINSFFADINNFGLYVYDFNGKLINAGNIIQGTEERQIDLDLLLTPFKTKDYEKDYLNLIDKLVQNRDTVSFYEYVDYDKQYHFVKVRPRY